MASLFSPNVGCAQAATERKTVYAASVLHLYKSTLTPSVNSVLADFTAAEAGFDGYATQTLTTWFDPGFLTGGGYQILSPAVQFEYVDGVGHVSNTIGGAYMVDAGGHLRLVLALAPGEVRTFAANGDFWNIQLTDVFPTGL